MQIDGHGSCCFTGYAACSYGGIESRDGCVFKIGERNLKSVCEELDKLGLQYDMTYTSGKVYRTLIGSVKSGRVDVLAGCLRVL